jgi:hypothetical protein
MISFLCSLNSSIGTVDKVDSGGREREVSGIEVRNAESQRQNSHREAEPQGNQDEQPTVHGLFQVEGNTVEREFDTHRRESAPVKALETLPLPQFGEAGLDERLTVILGPRGGLAQHLRHRHFELLTLIAR